MEKKSFGNNNRDNRGGGRRPGGFAPKPKPEFDQKIVAIRRVTRVVAGGRRFSFSVVIALGDKKGRVGVGLGKAGDTSLAIEKAINSAKKNMIKLALTKTSSIRQQVDAKYGSSRVFIKPSAGKGMVAGSSIRTILELAGVKDINAKIISRSKNKLNIARATMTALAKLG